MPATNKPFLFGVEEKNAHLEENINAFQKAISGKRVLFIELTAENIQQIIQMGKFSHMPFVAAYQKLALLAHKAGLRIVPLDEQKTMDKLSRAEISATIIGNPDTDMLNKEIAWHLDFNERERNWIRKLKTANSKAIAVMAPGHAGEIVKKLRIPKENIFGKIQNLAIPRQLAANEAARRKEARALMERFKAEQELGRFGSFAKRRQARKKPRFTHK